MTVCLTDRWCRAAFWLLCAVVAVLSLVPTEVLPPSAFDWSDKAQHALGFAALGAVGLLAYPERRLGLFAGLLAFGGVIELVQATTTWRQGEWADWLADGVGLGAAWGAVWAAWAWRRRAADRTGAN